MRLMKEEVVWFGKIKAKDIRIAAEKLIGSSRRLI